MKETHPLLTELAASTTVSASPAYVQTVGPFLWPTNYVDLSRVQVIDDEWLYYVDENGREWQLDL